MEQEMTEVQQERLFRRSEAAEYIRATWNIPCSTGTLAKYAVIGGGPAFRKAGNVPLYPESALRAWAESKLSPLVHSTSELQPAAA
jgi:hypothetical protein